MERQRVEIEDGEETAVTGRFFTPAEWEAERGEPWPADWAVYYHVGNSRYYRDDVDWRVDFYRNVLAMPPVTRERVTAICATDAGCPPAGFLQEAAHNAEEKPCV